MSARRVSPVAAPALAFPSPETIRTPAELRALDLDALARFAEDVRRFLLANVSVTGGHIGANLGTVELTLALHRVFDSPRDAILFDTGHQGYTHKIVTGRAHLFPTLDRAGGMNRFLTRTESEHDPIEASHAGTAVSIGLGLALAKKLTGDDTRVVAVVGDGSLAEGLTLEGLNHAAVERTGLVLVLNDNGYAISPGFGALHEALRDATRARALFEALGIEYFGPVDGHDLRELVPALERARASGRLPLVHCRTVKGKGWAPAARHPFRAHFSFPFDPVSGEPRGPAPARGYPDAGAAVLADEMERDEALVCITPSTLYATGLAPLFARHPERCFDPGMEEQHALTLAAGLALGGKTPVVAYQSTFFQRAFDQLVHDLCFLARPALLLLYRSGFAGYDNPTHHGIYDLAYLRAVPNLRVCYPKDRFEAERMVRDELRELTGPTAILMPYGPADEIDATEPLETRATFAHPEVDYEGRELVLLAVGNRYRAALEAVEALRERGIDAGLVNLRYLKPLPEAFLAAQLARAQRLVTLEEGVLEGGVGSAIAALAADHDLRVPLLRIGLPCAFVAPGSNAELARAHGLDGPGVLARIRARWPELA
jgi:1-deoxy-D-xylulose-5-phosphate synthase